MAAIETLADLEAAFPWNQPHRRTLEEYLRALWLLVQAHRQEPVTWAVISELLTAAFSAEPAAFDQSWLRYKSPPFSQKREGFAYLQHMLLYQIADLHRMREAGTLNFDATTLYFGVDSPTGHRWYNFEINGFFECAFSGAEGNLEESSWENLAELLYLGQIYE